MCMVCDVWYGVHACVRVGRDESDALAHRATAVPPETPEI